jgi:hypothetical protein
VAGQNLKCPFGSARLNVIPFQGVLAHLETLARRHQAEDDFGVDNGFASKGAHMTAHGARRLVLALAVSYGITSAADAQVLLDLSGTGSFSQTVDPGSIEVVIENRIPMARYSVTVRRELIPIAAISFDPIGSLGGLTPKAERSDDPCTPLEAAVAALNSAASEAEVPARRALVAALLESKKCTATATVAAANTALAAVRQPLTPVPIRRGERLTVTVTRPASDGQVLQWTLVLETEPRGEWITTFGVTLLEDQDELFHTEAADNEKFRVVADQETSGLKVPMPSVYFSWLSSKQKRRDWAWSPTIGFGLDGESIGVFGGLALTFNQNISVMGGVAVAGDRRLLGRYQADQEVGENLTEDQLHRIVYHAKPFVGLTVRFDRNPFKSEDTPPAEVTAPPAAASVPAKPSSPPSAPPAVGGAAATGDAPTAEAARDSDIKLRFDAKGGTRDPAALAALLKRAAAATDIFVISHGWWNDEATADCFYRRIVGGLEAAKPSYLTGERYVPLYVTVYWPSALFPMEPGDCAAERRTESTALTTAFTPSRVRTWAEAAFPEAATRSEFPAESDQLAALLERERTGSLSDPDAETLAAILVRWRSASGQTSALGEGAEPAAFSGSAKEIASRWRNRPEVRAELSLPGVFSPKKWLNFGNAFTFWMMKERAGTVGAIGLHDVIKALQPLRGPNRRVHLIGHSFGGKVVTASLTGTGGPANRVDTLVILQGAFSQFAFATRDEIRTAGVSVDRDGLYRAVLGSRLVSSPIIVTYSSADLPNRVLYPAGVALVNDVTEAARAPRYGSLGAQGIRGAPSTLLTLAVQKLSDIESASPRAVSVDASGVILNHSDLIKPAVFGLIWDAIEHSR